MAAWMKEVEYSALIVDSKMASAARQGNKERYPEKEGSGAEQTLLSGEEWYRYFQDTYGADNVNGNVSSFDDMLAHPTSLRGYTVDEIADILGDGWTRGTYGTNGSGWKFIQNEHPDNMVFYHGGGGYHDGPYYGISFGEKMEDVSK